jgi:hypothetical protein
MTDYGFGSGVGLFESIALINKQKAKQQSLTATTSTEPISALVPIQTAAPAPADPAPAAPAAPAPAAPAAPASSVTSVDKPKRKAIPKSVREKLWMQTFGDNSFNGNCYCCNSVIDVFHWEAGHINSVHNGGSDKLDNIRVVCISCNRSMNTCNMDDFKTKYFPK